MALDLTPSESGPPRARTLVVCALIILLSEIATFEILMVFPAIPYMAAEFQTSNITWVVSVVTLVGAIVLPLSGKAGDRFGKKRVLLVLATIFVVGSVLCATTSVFGLFLLGRLVQGGLVGAVGISYALIRDIIPRTYVPIALGSVVTGIGMGAVAGPFLAGWLIDSYGYQGIFWFMAIYVTALLPLHASLVPESTVRVKTSFDVPGAVLLGLALALLLVVVGKGNSWGWFSVMTLGGFGVAAALLAAFVLRELRSPAPLIDLRVLVGRRFASTVVAVGLVSYMMNAHSVMSPNMLETPHVSGNTYGVGLSALELAVWTFPLGAVGMFSGPFGGYLARKIGGRQVLLMSAGLYLVVMFLGAQLFTVQWKVAITSCVGGFAVGFLHSSNANLLQDALPVRLSGVGNSIAGVVALLSAAIGATVTGAIMAGHTRMTLPQSHTVIYSDAAFTQAYLWSGVVGVVAICVVLLMKHGRQPARGGIDDDETLEPADEATTPVN